MPERSSKLLLISEVARGAGVNPQTVLFYERRGLIPKAGRRSSGYREFDPETVDVIGFIQRAQELGFTLNEISELLSLRDTDDATCAEVCERTSQKLRLIDAKIERLRAMRRGLAKLLRLCSAGKRPVDECVIIQALEKDTVRSTI